MPTKEEYVKRALKELGYKSDDTVTISDIENEIIGQEQNIKDIEELLDTLPDLLKTAKEQLTIYKTLRHQVEVEEYKELNKGLPGSIY